MVVRNISEAKAQLSALIEVVLNLISEVKR